MTFDDTREMNGGDTIEYTIELYGEISPQMGIIQGFPFKDPSRKIYAFNSKRNRTDLIPVSSVTKHFPKTP